jgi:MIP family channel proteins
VVEKEWWKPAIAEFVGVFALVYIGAGSIVMSQLMGMGSGPAQLVLVALAHGLAIGVMVTAVAHISGAHFNPAVTVGALFTRKIKTDLGIIYLAFQLLGGAFGALLLVASLPAAFDGPSGTEYVANLGTPGIQTVTTAQAVFIEAILTFFLVFVIFGVAVDPKNNNGFKAAGGLAIGLTVAMDVLMGGPLTGAAMNPARAFGPALVAGHWADHLVYWAGPLLGGILAALVYDTVFMGQKEAPPTHPDSKMPRDEAPAGEASKGGEHTPEPQPGMTPGGHDPTSLDDPRS